MKLQKCMVKAVKADLKKEEATITLVVGLKGDNDKTARYIASTCVGKDASPVDVEIKPYQRPLVDPITGEVEVVKEED